MRYQKENIAHGSQNDTYSCGLVTVNTIAHHVLGEPLWTPTTALTYRLKWFSALKEGLESKVTIISILLNMC